MNEPAKKLFVLDTNVILHDSSCIHRFEEHDVVLPITVLEELDRFKKGNEAVNFHAREFVRTLDALSGDSLFNGGVSIGSGGGRLTVQLERPFHEDLGPSLTHPTPDNHILNLAYSLHRERADRAVVLVSKDVNLRMKAKSVSVHAQDYTSDHVEDPANLYQGYREVTAADDELVSRIYEAPYTADPAPLDLAPALKPNEFLILRSPQRSALARLDPESGLLRRVDKRHAYNITPRNAEQTFALDALLDPRVELVSMLGKAGTGKTLLALAAALEQTSDYHDVCVARPVVPLSNKDLGFLPGDIQSKLNPYMQPLYDNLGVIKGQFTRSDAKSRHISDALDNGTLTITALSYIRGRSLSQTFFIIDEAQNLTPHEVKTVITRAGEGTKIVVTGDVFQIDHPYLDSHSNGLSHLISKMQGHPLYAHVTLHKGERSRLAEIASNVL